MAIKDGSRVRRKNGSIDGSGDDRLIGVVSKGAAAVAGLTMGNPEWDDNAAVFVVFDDPKGINLGWIHPSELEEVIFDEQLVCTCGGKTFEVGHKVDIILLKCTKCGAEQEVTSGY